MLIKSATFPPSPACFLWQQHKCFIDQEQEDLQNQVNHWGRWHLMILITIRSASMRSGEMTLFELCWDGTHCQPVTFDFLLCSLISFHHRWTKERKRLCCVDKEGSILESVYGTLTLQNNSEHVESDKQRESLNQDNLTRSVEGIRFWQARVWL